jgi:hypothetical protein
VKVEFLEDDSWYVSPPPPAPTAEEELVAIIEASEVD